jgi:uncharacterized protein (TIGR03437 family)
MRNKPASFGRILALTLCFTTFHTAFAPAYIGRFPNQKNAHAAAALSGQWMQSAGPAAWPVTVLLVKGEALFAGGAGLWRMNQTGGIWNPANRGLPAIAQVTALAALGATLFTGTRLDGLYRSTDNGDNWARVRNGLPASSFFGVSGFAAIGSTLFLCSQGEGVYRSTDGGENWTAVNNGLLTSRYVNALTAGGDHLLAATEQGIYRSADNGANWTKLGNGAPAFYTAALAVAGPNIIAQATTGLYRSADNGATWTRGINGLPANSDIATFLAKGEAIYAGLFAGGVYRSNDGGANWLAANNGLPDVTINALAADETGFVAATSAGVFRSGAVAPDWRELPSGIVQSRIRSFAADGARVFVGTASGLFISNNNGLGWKAVGQSLPRLLIPGVAVSGNHLFAAVRDEFITKTGIYRSSDNGATWTKTNNGLPRDTFIRALAAAGNNLYAGVDRSGVYRSTDNGESWKAVNAGFLASTLTRSFSVIGSSLYACTEAGLYASTNNGDNWTAVRGGLASGPVLSVAAHGNSLVAVTLSNGLYRSTDNGATWSEYNGTGFSTRLPTATTGFLAIGSELLASVNGGGVYSSTDNGANWATMNAGLNNRLVQHLFVNNGRLFAGTDGGGLFFFFNAAGLLANVSAAGFTANAPLAPESIVAAFGSSLAGATEIAASTPLPLSLAGASVRVKDSAGLERTAPLFAVTPAQINYQIPEGTAAGPAMVTVLGGTGDLSAAQVTIAPVAPGLFSANADGRGIAAAVALRVRADGSQSYEPVARFDAARNLFVAIPIDLGAAAGDRVILVLYGSGLRFRSALSAAAVDAGGVSLPVDYAGAAPGLQGVDQVNVTLPATLAGRGEINLSMLADSRASNAVQISIR